MAVQGAPSSCSNRISLRATRLSVSRLLPLNTVAYVPCNEKDEYAGLEKDLNYFKRFVI